MIPKTTGEVWAFDAEWVPDAELGRELHGLAGADDRTVMEAMWQAGGADEEDPRPYLKTVLCRVVSIVALRRPAEGSAGALRFMRLPAGIPPEAAAERAVVGGFLDAVAAERPQLVGFNSKGADLLILMQRAVAMGIPAAGFCRLDYLAWRSNLHVDLMAVLGGGGRSNPSLHQMATACGIPGKMDVGGADVAEMWLDGRLAEIVAYNELDVVTTYLLWLQTALFAGRLDAGDHAREVARLEAFLEGETPGRPHLGPYLERWRRLRAGHRPS